jgi:oligopeptide transport system substrate-binding protein
MYRTLIGILSVFALALLVAGLTFSTTVERRADFRFVNGTEPGSLDPQLTTGEPESRLNDAMFEGLTRFDARTLRPAPGVAESWDISEDGLVYTFHLRANARWSNGELVTAQDFVLSWKRLLNPIVAAEYAYMLFPIRHAEALNTFETRANSLETKILPALRKLRATAGSGLDAHAWQRFLSAEHVNDPLRGQDDPKLEPLLARRHGSVSAADLAEFEAVLQRAVIKLREGAREAKLHFGVDQGVRALDARTLVVELRSPTPYFLELTSHHSAYPVPRSVSQNPKVDDDWFLPGKIVSNGPYRLAAWIVNDHIRLERSETYWGKDEVKLERIDVLPNDNVTTTMNLYLTGAVDWLPKYYPQEMAPLLRKRPDFYAEPGLSVYFYRFNTTKKPFDDRRVRQAISLAVDREMIVRDVRGLGELPAHTIVPPGLAGYKPPASGIRYDVREARRLLAEAGYPDGKGFPRVGILYNTFEDHKKIAEVISDQLKRNLGVEITAYNQEWQSYLESSHAMDYEISRAGWIGDYLDPNTFLDMWVTNGDNNYTGFSSQRYDRLIRLAADVRPLLRDPEPRLADLRDPEPVRALLAPSTTGSPADQRSAREKLRFLLFREAESILVTEEFPIMPLFFYVDAGLIRSHVRGFSMRERLPDGSMGSNLQDRHPLRSLWVDESARQPQ